MKLFVAGTILQVYPASDSDFQFISGVKKHQQYSLDGIKGVNIADQLEDISQVQQYLNMPCSIAISLKVVNR